VLYLGYLIDRSGPERALALHYAAGVIFIGAIALFAMPYALLAIVIFFSGMTIIGSQTGANATAGALYRPACAPAASAGHSASGASAASRRRCSAAGSCRSVCRRARSFLSACGFALIAAIATALLVFRGERAEQLVASPAAE
jgi:hypothetical protein